jgi:histidyl-tRNA synthetase
MLPQERAIELVVLEKISEAFKRFGFLNIENRAVEPIQALLAKGETSKEVYLLSRLQEAYENSGENSNHTSLETYWKDKLTNSKQLGLHFDLTVPFARYVVENAGQLNFPFRRTSVGKVWRGERPQAGRFREFTQADVDIVARVENGQSPELALPVFQDADVVKAVDFALRSLNSETGLQLPPGRIHVSNRKFLQGCHNYLQVHDFSSSLQILDKLEKIGADQVRAQLLEIGETPDFVTNALALASICTADIAELTEHHLVQEIVQNNELAATGLAELTELVTRANAPYSRDLQRVVVDLKITRGLDYYTGSVFETFLEGLAHYGSVASGGRYDNLASSLTANSKVSYPGVGMSIGVTRLLSIAFDEQLLHNEPLQQADILVVVNDEASRAASEKVTDELRQAGIRCYTSPTAAKFGKQIEFADKRSIPYVLFIDDQGAYQIKDIRSGEQVVVNSLEDWANNYHTN